MYFEGVEAGVLIVDRYAAYKAMAQVTLGKILLAFCWTHVRRDFLDVAKDWPSEESWGMDWVRRNGELFHLNDLRLKVRESPTAFAEQDQNLRQAIDRMARQREEALGQSGLHPARRQHKQQLLHLPPSDCPQPLPAPTYQILPTPPDGFDEYLPYYEVQRGIGMADFHSG